MRITFVLPAPIRIPMGGAAVVYGYADQLAAWGHEVTVLAPRQTARGLLPLARRAAVAVRNRLHGVADAPYYRPALARALEVDVLDADAVPDGDLVVATGVQTAESVAALPPSKGRGVYFIQGDETFVRPDARATWHLPLARLTCAAWLREAVEAAGLPVVAAIPNAVDAARFGLDRPLDGRGRRVVALYHRHPVKGPDLLVATLARLRDLVPDVEADVFCARPPVHALPPWVRVHVRPTPAALRALYNAAAVTLHTSRSEGWPLVPMEAAVCGCAIAALSNPGIRGYLTDRETMAEVPAGDASALAETVARLLRDDAARIALAERGAAHVRTFDPVANARALQDALGRILRGEA